MTKWWVMLCNAALAAALGQIAYRMTSAPGFDVSDVALVCGAAFLMFGVNPWRKKGE